jgi:hypothetical protein
MAQSVSKRVAAGNLTARFLSSRSRLIDCGTTNAKSEPNVLQGPVRRVANDLSHTAPRYLMTRPISRLLGCGTDSHQSPIGIKSTVAALTLTPSLISSSTQTVGSRLMLRYAYQLEDGPCVDTKLISAHGLGVSVVATSGLPGAGPNQFTGFGPTLLSGSWPPAKP